MNEQPDPVIRKTVSLRARVWKEIEDYQFANRVKRDSEAIRRLRTWPEGREAGEP
jgi:hypothetical protein